MVQLLPKIADSNWLKDYIDQSGFYPGSGSDFQIMFDVPRGILPGVPRRILPGVPRGILPTAKWVFVDYGGQPNEDRYITMACGNEVDLHSFQGARDYVKVDEVIDITKLFLSCYEPEEGFERCSENFENRLPKDLFPQKVLYSIYYNEREKHAIEVIFLMGFAAINSYNILYEHGECALFLLKEGLGTKYSQHTEWHTPLEKALRVNSPTIIVSNDGPYGQNKYNECVPGLGVDYQQLKTINIQEQEMTVFKKLKKKN